MKKIIYTILLMLNLLMVSHAMDRFPSVVLDNCSENNHTPSTIYQCELNNLYTAQKTLAIFYLNIQLFLPDEYEKLLEESQNKWNKFSTFECQINAHHFKNDPEKSKLVNIRCLAYRIKLRVQHLIYIVMVWEEKLGSFKVTIDQPEHLKLPFTLQAD